MKMKICFLLLLYFGLTCCREVYAENAHDIKRGAFPYMAFIYYSDPSVVDATGQRFVRSAVLIRPDWLVTSALGPSIVDPSYDFPNKTLLARAGAIAIDDKFTLNEDEDEQEREVVQIVRPYNHSESQWWTTDISLLKTLLPFNITSAVDVKSLNLKSISDYKACNILVYTKKISNLTEEKTLMMLFVELLPPSIDNCGSHFKGSTMACAVDSDENRNADNVIDFCQGNSGGPLICKNDVIGLQTYIGDNCKQPHLYQLLHIWDNFITCAIEDKCQEEHCGHICEVNFKDRPNAVAVTLPVNHDIASDDLGIAPSPEQPSASTVFGSSSNLSTVEIESTIPTLTMIVDEFHTSESISEMPESPSSIFMTVETITDPTHTTLLKDKGTEESWHKDKSTEKPWTKEKETIESKEKDFTWPEETETTLSKDTETTWLTEIATAVPKNKAWPKNKESSERSKDDDENSERQAQVEAQQHEKEKKRASAANGNVCVIQTVLFVFIVLLCL